MATILVITVGVYAWTSSLLRRARVSRRVRLASGVRRLAAIEEAFAVRSAAFQGAAGKALAAVGAFFPLGDEDRTKIVRSLQRAGFRSSNSLTIVLGFKTACVVIGLAGGIVVSLRYVDGLTSWTVGAVVGVLLGLVLNLLPELAVARLGAARLRRIHAALPDGLDLMIVALEAGLTFERTMVRCVQDLRVFQPDLAGELETTSLDMSVQGRTREEALDRLATRLDSQAFRDLATTVGQSERHGLPTADALRKLGASLRVQALATMQAKVARLPTLLILPTIAFVLPGIIVLVAGPALRRLTEQLGSFG